MSVPFNDLSRRAREYHEELRSVVERVLLSGRYILGSEGNKFEETFARHVGARFAIGVNSGTDALALALRALDVGVGDEVITVGNTAVPTVAAIRMTGAMPVFADIDRAHTMAPRDLEGRITKKTKAIIPVHLYGFPADMKKISAIARARDIPIIEDAAQSHDATIDGVSVGTFGICGAFSFYPTKNLGAFGDAGAIVTNDQSFAERIRRTRVYGERTQYDNVEEGVNSRMDELQAALLSWGLGHLTEWNVRRAGIVHRYQREITNPLVTLPVQEEGGRKGVWHLFVVQVDDRESFIKHLRDMKIDTAIHYPIPIYRQKAYSFLRVDPGEFPETERIVPRIVSLPLFPHMTDDEVGEVISAVNAYSTSAR